MRPETPVPLPVSQSAATLPRCTMYMNTKSPILVTALLLAGCAQNAGSYGVTAIQPEDLAVPKGMRLIERDHTSHVRESGAYRFANLTYEGSLSPTQVASYLLENLPLRNYQLEAKETPGKGQENLRFRRGAYVLHCTIQRQEASHSTKLIYKLRTHLKPH